MAQVINSEEFDSKVLKSKAPVLVDFYAEWCGPCKMLAPVLEQFSEEMKGNVEVFKVDIDKSEELTAKYGIVSVPTLILFNDGQASKRVSGVQSLQQLKAFVE